MAISTIKSKIRNVRCLLHIKDVKRSLENATSGPTAADKWGYHFIACGRQVPGWSSSSRRALRARRTNVDGLGCRRRHDVSQGPREPSCYARTAVTPERSFRLAWTFSSIQVCACIRVAVSARAGSVQMNGRANPTANKMRKTEVRFTVRQFMTTYCNKSTVELVEQ